MIYFGKTVINVSDYGEQLTLAYNDWTGPTRIFRISKNQLSTILEQNKGKVRYGKEWEGFTLIEAPKNQYGVATIREIIKQIEPYEIKHKSKYPPGYQPSPSQKPFFTVSMIKRNQRQKLHEYKRLGKL